MLCEICGRKIEKGVKIFLEGAELTVCKTCSKLGTLKKIEKPKKYPSKPIKEIEEPEIIENYGMIVKKAREKKNWSQKDLARKINEKESLIHRIETESILPTITVARKLEKALRVKLLEKAKEFDVSLKKKHDTDLTIGDIIEFKKK